MIKVIMLVVNIKKCENFQKVRISIYPCNPTVNLLLSIHVKGWVIEKARVTLRVLTTALKEKTTYTNARIK